MSGRLEDAAQMVESASALLINIGILNDYKLKVMLQAGKKANELEIPVILDPVGAGATDYREKAVMELLDQINFNIAGERAAETETSPAFFRAQFMDNIYKLHAKSQDNLARKILSGAIN